MRYTIIILGLIAIVSTSCKNRHKVKQAEQEMESLSTEGADSTVVNDAFSDLENDFDFDEVDTTEIVQKDNLFASVERGACFGRCPIYKMQIFESGKATYEGINFVDMMGTYQTIFSSDELNKIKEKSLELGLDTMQLEYDRNGVTDLPTTMLGAPVNDSYKKIKMRYGYPENLKIYRDFLDKVIASKEWEKAASVND